MSKHGGLLRVSLVRSGSRATARFSYGYPRTMMTKPHYISNAWHPASGGGAIPVIDPSTGETFGELARGTEADIASAVAAARAAIGESFDGPWGRMSAALRGRLMLKLSAAVTERNEELAQIEARDCGKPLKPRAPTPRPRALFRVLRRRLRQAARRDASVPDRLHGADVARAARRHRPHHPVELSAADLRPLGRRRARRGQCLRRQAGRGRLPLAPARCRARGRGRLARRRAQRRHRARPRGGRGAGGASRHRSHLVHRLARRPARGRGRRRPSVTVPVTLELGGKSPQIVFADADLDAALPVIVNAIVQNAGQTCSAGSRLLVQRIALRGGAGRLGADASRRSAPARQASISIAGR